MTKKEYYIIKTKSLLGDGEALFELAWMHIWGIECAVNLDKAYSLLEESVKNGFADAKKSLEDSLVKENGTVGFTPSFAEIYEPVRELRLAAENGDAMAQYLFGQGKVTGDDASPYMKKRGFIWLNKSANQKCPPAMFLLGMLYWFGNGVPKDENKGLSLIKDAARGEHVKAIQFLAKDDPQFVLPILNKLNSESNAEAQGVLGQMYMEGVGVERDTNKGISYWEESAKNGSSDSMFNLGLCYEKGMYGVPKDIDMAIRWFNMGAEAGDVQCMINLGSILQDKDPKKAFDLLTKAAEEEEPHALCNLGTLYKRGLGCEKNPEKALSCYERSANTGCVSAMVNLVKYYSDDIAVPHDYEKADKWLRMAADNGDEDSMITIANFYANGIHFEQNYSEAKRYYEMAVKKDNPKAMVALANLYQRDNQYKGNWETAKELLQKAISLDYIPAYYELGLYYCYPHVQDYEEAVKCYKVAAEAEYPPAEYELGVCYRCGDGVPKDMEKAVYWMSKASKEGYHLATNNLGLYYLEGIGVERDLKKAVDCFKEAAENDIPDAQTMLGICYFTGNGVEQDYSKALEWLIMAAENHNEPDAQYHLYLSYSKGLGVEMDKEKAMRYLQLAADEGFDEAIRELAEVKKSSVSGYVDRAVLENTFGVCGGMMLHENGEPYIVHHICPEDRAGKPMDGVEYHKFLIDSFLDCLKKVGEDVEYYRDPIQNTKSYDNSEKFPDLIHFNASGSGRQVFYKIFSKIESASGWNYNDFISICKDTNAYGKIILGESYCLDTNGEIPINGSAFATRFKSFSVFPIEGDSKLDNLLGSADLVQILASAWEKLDISGLTPFIGANCHYGSDWVFVEKSSRSEYLDYLDEKFKAIIREKSVVELYIDRDFETDNYSILMSQDNHCSRLIFNSEKGRFVDIRMIQAIYPRDWEEEYSKRVSSALPRAIEYIDNYFRSEGVPETEVKWNTIYMSSLHFQHLNFTYGGNIYSVLIELIVRGDDNSRHVHNLILLKDIKNQLRETENNDMIPCVLPLDINTFEPLVGGFHLVNTKTKRNVVPFIRDGKVIMTDWEIQNLGINYVMQWLKSGGLTVYDFCDVPTMEPNVWFVGNNNKKSYVVVNAICANNKERLGYKVRHHMVTELSEYDGYYAEVIIHSAEAILYDINGNIVPLSQRFNNENPVGLIHRGEKVSVFFDGLQYIETKAADSGVTDETLYIIDPKKDGLRQIGEEN